MHENVDNGNPFSSKRRFVVLAVACGWCSPDRLTEAIERDLLADTTAASLLDPSGTCDAPQAASATYPPEVKP